MHPILIAAAETAARLYTADEVWLMAAAGFLIGYLFADRPTPRKPKR